MQTFRQFLTEAISAQSDSDTTQIATTVGSYAKAAMVLVAGLPTPASVLDYGSGLGLGTNAIRQTLPDATVDGYEPSPARASTPPTYTSSDQIVSSYDGIICLNVLNVLEPALRSQVTAHLVSLLKPGGRAVIGARKFAGDIANTKGATPATEPGGVWVNRNVKGGVKKVYQKGFDGAELMQYVQRIAGPAFTVTRLPGITATAVLVTKK